MQRPAALAWCAILASLARKPPLVPGGLRHRRWRRSRYDAEEVRLIAVSPCGRVLPELEDRLRRLHAERAELAPLVTRPPVRERISETGHSG